MENKVERWSTGIPGRLRSARERKGLSQSELSRRAGLDRTACFRIESSEGDRDIGVLTLEKLARALDAPVTWLAFGDDDGPARIQGVLRELAAVKDDRFLLSGPEHEDEEDAEGPAETAAVGPAEEDRPDSIEAWPQGYRRCGVDHPDLPPLGRHYAPVLEALGSRLSEPRRHELGHWLVSMLVEDDHEGRRYITGWLRELLRHMVPDRDRSVAELVMQDLESDHDARRGMMILSLIVDGGLPVNINRLEMAGGTESCPRQLERALEAALRILRPFVPEADHPLPGP